MNREVKKNIGIASRHNVFEVRRHPVEYFFVYKKLSGNLQAIVLSYK